MSRLGRIGSQWMQAGLVVSLVLLASSVTWSTFGGLRGATQARVGLGVDRSVDRWERFAANGRWRGVRDAEVVIVEFGDYQCPYCRVSESTLQTLLERYEGRIAVVHKHLPLTGIHPHAYKAARLSECAAELGRFEAAHRYLFGVRDLSRVTAERMVAAVAFPDDAAFLQCSARSSPVGSIEQDMSDARELGINRTPSFMVQGMLLARNPDLEGFIVRVDSLLALKRPAVGSQ